MTTLILLSAVIVVTAAISASIGWLFGYNQAIRQHQASLSDLIGKAKPSRLTPAANDPAADKNSISALQGAQLYEIAELGSEVRAESKMQKSFLSQQVVRAPAKPLG